MALVIYLGRLGVNEKGKIRVVEAGDEPEARKVRIRSKKRN
jgi:hypothetical protein